MSVHIAGAAYAVPDQTERVEDILERERGRVNAALDAISPSLRKRIAQGLGLHTVRVCGARQPLDLALQAASLALDRAGLRPRDVGLIVDFSTFPGPPGPWVPLAQRLAGALRIETSVDYSFRVGGCAGLHLALQCAKAIMADGGPETALLVTADTPPPECRSLLPVTVQGDAASAMVLCRGGQGPELLGTELMTVNHLYDAIRLEAAEDAPGGPRIHVDASCIENYLMPVYYLNFHRIVHSLLRRTGVSLADIRHFVYSNLSALDQSGFLRALSLTDVRLTTRARIEYGHTFASDLVINYTDLVEDGAIRSGDLILFASAGIGFTWGVTLARA